MSPDGSPHAAARADFVVVARETRAVTAVRRANTILYTDRWVETVSFYGEALGLTVAFENDWFVEFDIGPGAFVSVADARRTSIQPGRGDGITLSWQVDDVHDVRAELLERGVETGAVGTRWGAAVLDVFDPAGNRVEFWSEPAAFGTES